MGRDVAPDTCRGGGCRESAREYPRVERRVSAVVGEQPAAVVMGEPQAAQLVENRLWQRHQPLLVALADDAQHQVGSVNGANLQRGGFADAQAARIHNGEAHLVNRVADNAEQMPDLILRQRLRQPLLTRGSDPFSPRTIPTRGQAYGNRGNAARTGWS